MIVPLFLGFFSSLHCVGMCGPIALALPVHQFSVTKKTLYIITYHLGRILTYALLGVLFGLLGNGLFIAGLHQNVSIILGILLILGVLFFNESSIQSKLYTNTKAYMKFKSYFGTFIQKKTWGSFLVLGLLNGLLPCAMVYMALFGATATQGALHGAMFMMWFGVGTIPLMTAVVWLSQWVNKYFKNKLKKLVPIFLILTGVLLIVRGMGLNIPFLSPSALQLFITGNPQCF